MPTALAPCSQGQVLLAAGPSCDFREAYMATIAPTLLQLIFPREENAETT